MPTENSITGKPAPNRINLKGERFGLLVVVDIDSLRNQNLYWKCLCDCGNTTSVRAGHLRAGAIRSCGCQEGRPGHRLSRTPAYNAIKSAWHRCGNPSNPKHKDYYGRGIKVCIGWRNPENFVNDMGQPNKGQTLDRIDNNGNYSCGKCEECKANGWPMNCRWASRTTQNRNQRSNHWITARGKTMTMIEWRIETGLPKSTIINRLKRGWSEEDAVTIPSRR